MDQLQNSFIENFPKIILNLLQLHTFSPMISFSVKLRTCKVFYNFSLIISNQLNCFESVLIMRIHDVCKEIYGDYLKICCRIIGAMKNPCVSLWNGADTIISWNDHIQCIEYTQNKRYLGFFKIN